MARAAPDVKSDAKAFFEMEKKDPAMIAYLRSLGMDPDYVGPADDPRKVVVQNIEILFRDHHKSQIIRLETEADLRNATKNPLVIKQGAEYKITVTFRVQHDVLSGFKINSTVYKLGKTLAKESEHLGSYPPSIEFKTVEIGSDWAEAPTGRISRGNYKSKLEFADSEGNSHLVVDYAITIAKDYAD